MSQLCIVVTCYGQSGLLSEALGCAVSQSPPCRIVLVNDGCPQEETHNACLVFRDAFPHEVIYVRQNNSGPAAARNIGIDLAFRSWPDTEAIFFLDGDNRLTFHAIHRLYVELLDSGADWVFSDLNLIGESGLVGMAGDYSVLEQLVRNYIDTGSLVSRRVFDAGVRFDPAIAMGFEDWDFWLEAASRGFRGTYLPASGFQYRRRSESRMQDALQNTLELAGAIRRKHQELINPRACVRREHHESPRYALLDPAERRVYLFTDPADRERVMPLTSFSEEMAHAHSARHFGRAPAYLISAHPEIIEQLDTQRYLHSVLQELEICAREWRSPIALIHDREDIFSFQTADGVRDKALILFARTESSFSDISRFREPFRRTLRLPVRTTGQATEDIITLIGDIQTLARSRVHDAAVSENSAHRRHVPLTHALSHLFDTGVLFPLATTKPRVGFLISAASATEVKNQALLLSGRVRDAGWSPHLFGYGDDQVDFEMTGSAFYSIAFFGTTEAGGNLDNPDADLVGALCQMDILVNQGCIDLFHLSGQLKRLGTRTIVSIDDRIDAARAEWLATGLEYENAIDVYHFESPSLAHRFRALGAPESKIAVGLESLWKCLAMRLEGQDAGKN